MDQALVVTEQEMEKLELSAISNLFYSLIQTPTNSKYGFNKI